MQCLWFDTVLLPAGWASRVRVRISAGRVVDVVTDCDPKAEDERLGTGLPGMPNLHSHAFQRGMAGLAEMRGPSDDSFWTWRDLMYRFANRIGPDELEAIAALAFVEMLEAGFTQVGEFHYIHHDRDGVPFADPAEMGARIAAAATEAGIGLTLLPVLYRTSGFGGAAPRPEQRRFVTDLDGYARLIEASRKLAPVGITPHSLRAVPEADLRAALALMDAGTPVHIHIAEQTGEVADCLQATGQRPVDWLLDHAPVDARWCLVHATHLSDGEIGRLAASGAVAGLCPITEANLGDGIFPARAFLEHGGRIGIGSDSNVLIAMPEELRTLEYAQRLIARGRNILASAQTLSTGRRLFDATVAGGAQALGQGAHGIAPGASADFLTLDPTHPTLAGRSGDHLIDALVFAQGTGMIDQVWRAGRRHVSNGRHLARDAVTRRYARALAGLMATA